MPQVYSQGLYLGTRRQIFLPVTWQAGYNALFNQGDLCRFEFAETAIRFLTLFRS